MNKFIISISFLLILTLHLSIINFFRTNKLESNQQIQNNTLKLQLSKVTEIKKEVTQEKVVEPKIEQKKEIVKKELPKKTFTPTITKALEITKEEKSEIKEEIQSQNISTQEVKPSTTPSVSQEEKFNTQEYMNQYRNRLREEINKNKTYPTISKKLKEEGKVIVSFRVLQNGFFSEIKLLVSSDKERLDKAALNALYDTKHFEPYDNKIVNKEYLDFEVPIDFKLN
ncbi:MAG: TonB family protein [Aliarcobacter sp.]|nr:TonB family protein [Aliarcobacter sp.]